MTRLEYRVFLNPPGALAVDQTNTYEWRTVSSGRSDYAPTSVSVDFPPNNWHNASVRLSAIYQGVIFGGEDDPSGEIESPAEHSRDYEGAVAL